MADQYNQQHGQLKTTTSDRTLTHRVSGESMIWASLAGTAIGGPLFGTMGFSFMATVTFLLICSPLLLISSPLLLFTAFVVAGSLTGFTTAIAMAIGGVLMLAWMYREVKGQSGLGFGGKHTERGVKDRLFAAKGG